MATATAPTPPPSSAPGTEQQPPDRRRAALLVGAILVAGLPGSAMLAPLVGALAPLGITMPVAGAALMLAMRASREVPRPVAPGPATLATLTWQAGYRAAYLVNAAVRMQLAVNGGATLEQAVTAERRFYVLHLGASKNRLEAAQATDVVAKRSGGLVGWRAVMDSRTSAECRLANGHNFHVDRPPVIGLPGAVHPHCRCRPVAPFRGAMLVDDVLGRRTLVAV